MNGRRWTWRRLAAAASLAAAATTLVVVAGAAAGPRSSSGRAVAAAANLAADPDFEADPSSAYYTNGTADFTWAADQSHSATHSLKIFSSNPSGGLVRWMSRTTAIPAVAGKTYYLSTWLRTANASRANLSLVFWNAGQTYLGVTADSQTVSGTTDWTRVTVQATAPAGSSFVRIEFRLTGSGTLWTDDVALADTAAPSGPTNTVRPSIGGPATVGQFLTAGAGSWTPTPTSFAYVWWLCDSSGANCQGTPLDQAYVDNWAYLGQVYSGSTLLNTGPARVLLPASAAGHRIKLTVFARYGGDPTTYSADSTLTNVVAAAPGPLPATTAPPVVTPPSDPDNLTFTASTGSWSNAPSSYGYQWLRCFNDGVHSVSCSDVLGATGSSYTAPADSDSLSVAVVVRAVNANGSGDVRSDSTGYGVPVTVLRLPRITGTAQTGSTLSADDGLWQGVHLSALDGQVPRFVWLRCDSKGTACEVTGPGNYEISSTYQLTQQDVGHTIRARVSVAAGPSEVRAISEPTAVVD